MGKFIDYNFINIRYVLFLQFLNFCNNYVFLPVFRMLYTLFSTNLYIILFYHNVLIICYTCVCLQKKCKEIDSNFKKDMFTVYDFLYLSDRAIKLI